MPSDILGTSVFDIATGRFNLKKGPVFTSRFAHFLDEIAN